MEYVRKGGVIAVRLLKGEEVVASLATVAARESVSAACGKPYLHLHVVLGGTENVYAGHLNEAYVSATAEIFVNVFAGSVGRFYDDETGLNLMKFED